MAPSVWLLFLGFLFLLGIFIKIYLLTALSVILVGLSLLAGWWQRRSLVNVNYLRKLYYRRGFPGEQIPIQITVENRKFLPLSWLRAEDQWPTAVAPEDESILKATHSPEFGMLVNLFSLRWFERTRRTYSILLRKRGVYRLGPAQLESGDLFGLFEKVDDVPTLDTVTVFPQPLPFRDLRLPTEDPFGDRSARRRLYEDPNRPMGIRDYHPEDDFRRIHWPATAHTGDLQVKVYQPISSQVMVICLNVNTLPHYWEGTYPGLLEHLVRVTATLVQRGLQDGYRVGLVSNGCLAHADQPFRVPPGRSPKQEARLLEVLAGVTPFATISFERFLMAEMPRLPYGATVVIVTGLMNAALTETIFRIKQHGWRITLLSFAHAAPPDIPGVNIIHQPFIE